MGKVQVTIERPHDTVRTFCSLVWGAPFLFFPGGESAFGFKIGRDEALLFDGDGPHVAATFDPVTVVHVCDVEIKVTEKTKP